MAKSKTTTKTTTAKTTAKKAPVKKAATAKSAAKKSAEKSAAIPETEPKKKPATTKVRVKKGAAPTDEQIAARAYQIWTEQGCPDGNADDNWKQAESELNG
jgi:hypothetical protein